MVHIGFTGGGTGGHIYPGLAVAAVLQKLFPCRIFWIGSETGMDRSIVERAGLEFYGIPAGKLRRYLSLKNASDIFKTGAGFFAARKILKKERPSLFFSKGGFVSVPPCVAAASLGIPVFTHDSDFSPGLATKINARFASRIFTAFDESAAFFPLRFRPNIVIAGNPVRSAFYSADPAAGRAFLGLGPGERVFLVLGGSQGARELNELVRETLPLLTRYYTVVHQTGPVQGRGFPRPEQRYKPYPYIGDEMPQVLAAAELVLGRGGAGTVWECAAAGKPMLLLPLRGSGTRGDQVENARFFEKAGAAMVLGGSPRETAVSLEAAVSALAGCPEKRAVMGASAAAMGKLNGAELIARAIQSFLEG
jgi:UDP-N-acetylglucosamine--N-acetylmuramyl-(pentapeptide) pyrophosphoryl-undecaprenol N-acetylglucosamine transferase